MGSSENFMKDKHLLGRARIIKFHISPPAPIAKQYPC